MGVGLTGTGVGLGMGVGLTGTGVGLGMGVGLTGTGVGLGMGVGITTGIGVGVTNPEKYCPKLAKERVLEFCPKRLAAQVTKLVLVFWVW